MTDTAEPIYFVEKFKSVIYYVVIWSFSSEDLKFRNHIKCKIYFEIEILQYKILLKDLHTNIICW